MTGTIIHTNLGRAQISRAMAQAGVEAAINPVTLEYDLDESRRGDRDAAIEPMLCALDRRAKPQPSSTTTPPPCCSS